MQDAGICSGNLGIAFDGNKWNGRVDTLETLGIIFSDDVNLSSYLRCVYVVGALEDYVLSYGVFGD